MQLLAPGLHPSQLSDYYAGALTLLHPSPRSLKLVALLQNYLQQAFFPAPDPQRAHCFLGPDYLRWRVHNLRQKIQQDRAVLRVLAEVIAELELASDLWVDLPRLRAVAPQMHQIPAAAPAFSAHRDTWYANPAAQINLWIPLGNYAADQCFVFYPDYFEKPVANDSEFFDYQDWLEQVGWQGLQAPPETVYPQALQKPEGPQFGFACQAGQRLLFSGTHLHQPQPNQRDEIRFSLDLRMVSFAAQAAGSGAPQVDNASRGSTWPDFVPLENWR
ncbi:hypothetical protein COW36_11915 [bacterium (Candidatus Blackallbacteria) CG17_big_fil_post_rev_8_21_14_2_50_48_46]|uniref:Phytanoyl-CoA dioxygenase n=1 Tax=bacterium (Candidatus Blackallbacteria) CG17_big_fil_post_rev_8_21_14_2_50_48_46 TaxID=2014261 RepID=A0A2M7G3M4_9BACT|nr:MAG: hypothetical protein COW64_03345 [bacterium (Candidatus Blackallbacteria) CG18_big_fil_WC_8_21_14_2_50_49_26]PIW16469.1 MAG: hypothetical protein COW36_11915 [bacterium (Candidatus Blackallbacteria) CG17_big_fil_post_rev_8_21_14_2_50_48_46]PIW45977.1 MAG: hypothetical protein COW20_17180 [bacterium (Candidatus Blackallbacteria) CG13_big_fil_rev_8_21_14_2_50_49_14]